MNFLKKDKQCNNVPICITDTQIHKKKKKNLYEVTPFGEELEQWLENGQ